MLHDIDNNEFVLTIDNEDIASRYRMLNDNTIEFYSTHTPKSLRGHGHAAKLVNYALDYATEHNFKIIPTCWYVKKIIEQQK